ncbi:MAG: glycyl radical protein [Megasphaera sp.]|uniref:glycyl radical protein n=2 Tax=Megasphaera TaxID=906 RepID=UPI0025C09FCD|nr:glycyl radical protein [Megasphaera sp.]MCF0153394.1 glycyl radical protein [Megasphaera sp.]MCI7601162.1 glycyl radical protein [Megasphaera sp.]
MDVLGKGFTKPTARIQALRDAIYDATPTVEADRAELVTASYKETEGLPIILRRAKAVEKILTEIPIAIRDHELIVGSLTVSVHGCQIYPEYSFDWVEKEFDTMATRMADPFEIPKDTAKRLHDAFLYWPGKTTSDLATSYMSQPCLDAQANGVFTVGNYYFNGVGHVCVDYGKVLREGFSGIIREAEAQKAKLSGALPEDMKKRDFYDAVIITYKAAIAYAHRYADLCEQLAGREGDQTRKAELLKMAANCRRVPEQPATTWWEALQAFWFVQLILQIESSGHSISPGRFDQYMYPYLEGDKNISRDFAQELLDNVWIKFNDLNKTRDAVSDQAFAGYAIFQNIQCGGQDEDGVDATNPLSYMMIDAAAHVAMAAPSFSIRYSNRTPDEFLYRACELVRLGLGYPAMYNDEVIIPSMMNRGIPLKDARNYCIIGCVEPQVPHKTEGWHDAAFFNIAKVLDITLHNGRNGQVQLGPKTGEMKDFQNLGELMQAYKTQMEYFVKLLVEADNAVDYAHAERAPLPFESALVDDCLGRGKSMQEGGAIYNFTGPQAFGVADNGDSFMAIQKHVFEKGEVTMEELQAAMDHNFGYPDETGKLATWFGTGCCAAAGSTPLENMDERQIYEAVKRILSAKGSIDINELQKDLQQGTAPAPAAADRGDMGRYQQIKRIMENTTWFGNDDDVVDIITREAGQIYAREVQKYKNPRGGQFQAGCYPVSANVLFGKDVAPLPDGRLAWTPLADGVSPRAGCDTNGPTAAAMSVAKLEHETFSNGTLYNQKFNPAALAGDEGLKRFAALCRAFFENKGMHVQFNVIDKATLVEAQKHPEQHKDLVVRVAGYSAQFISLAKEVQDNIIDRTEFEF